MKQRFSSRRCEECGGEVSAHPVRLAAAQASGTGWGTRLIAPACTLEAQWFWMDNVYGINVGPRETDDSDLRADNGSASRQEGTEL